MLKDSTPNIHCSMAGGILYNIDMEAGDGDNVRKEREIKNNSRVVHSRARDTRFDNSARNFNRISPYYQSTYLSSVATVRHSKRPAIARIISCPEGIPGRDHANKYN